MMMSGTHTQKKLPKNISGKQLSMIFAAGVRMSSLKGKRVGQLSATEIKFEKLPTGGGLCG